MRKILTEIVATDATQPAAARGCRDPAAGPQLSGTPRRESPTELVCLALVLALVTLAGRILTIW
jgi:hypothetical protein